MTETTEVTSARANAAHPTPWASGVDTPLPSYGTACFICHRPFGDGVDRTEEDVIPKWVLRHLNLTGAAADLPTGQIFRYTQRKVPCCWDCNQRMSRDLELPVSAAFQAGYDAVLALDTTTLYLWLAKVYYGTRFRETGLRVDVTTPESVVMLEHTELLARNEHLRRCIQHTPEHLTLATTPASIFIFRAGQPAVMENQFDFFVPAIPGTDAIFIRVGGTFVICVFGDNGYWQQHFGQIRLVQAALSELVLHPAQCVELMAWLAAELAGHDSFGCYDMLTTTAADGSPRTVFFPKFEVEREDVPQETLNVARVGGMLTRLGFPPQQEILDGAAAGRFPTTLVNVTLDQLVQAECFELTCLGLFHRAGWTVSGSPCAKCGAQGIPAAR